MIIKGLPDKTDEIAAEMTRNTELFHDAKVALSKVSCGEPLNADDKRTMHELHRKLRMALGNVGDMGGLPPNAERETMLQLSMLFLAEQVDPHPVVMLAMMTSMAKVARMICLGKVRKAAAYVEQVGHIEAGFPLLVRMADYVLDFLLETATILDVTSSN